METLCELVRGPVYLTGEEVECSIKFTNLEEKGGGWGCRLEGPNKNNSNPAPKILLTSIRILPKPIERHRYFKK